MVTYNQIGGSIVYAFFIVIVFYFLWPILPKEGIFGPLSWQLKAAIIFFSWLVVIGPGRVAYDLITDSSW
jgi:hypothetical protein